MSNWKEGKLSDIATIIMGQSPQGETCNNFGDGTPLLNGPTEFGKRFPKPVQYTVDARKVCEVGDILFCVRGSTTGRMNWANQIFAIGRGLATIRHKKGKEFQYYVRGVLDFHLPFLLQGATGSTFPNVSGADLGALPILIPNEIEQETIAETLKSLDDKIDLLYRQNKTLEQLAKTHFNQHFVVEQQNMSKQLGDVVESANTGLDAIKRAPIVEDETGIKCLRIQDVSQMKSFDRWGNTEVEENNFKKFQLKRDDIIMARTCSPGINLFVREDLQAVFNNGLVRIRANKEKVHPILLNWLFKTREFIGHIDGISGGTSVQLNMQVGDLLSYEFSFPTIEKQNEIMESFIAFDEKIFYNEKQITTLTKLRDTLLPKLMSGEVKIEN